MAWIRSCNLILLFALRLQPELNEAADRLWPRKIRLFPLGNPGVDGC